MVHSSHYDSPLGGIFLSADEIGLTELRFGMQENAPPEGDTPILASAKRWLDIYFSGQEPDFTPPLQPLGTAFQMEVWEILRTIPYGQSITYGEIARKLAARRGIPKPSAQAVGGAVGRNPIGILIPCHRVLGKGGLLTGYAGGLEKKIRLLELEGIDFARP